MSSSTEDVVSVEPDKDGNLPVPLKGIIGVSASQLLDDIDPVGLQYELKHKKLEVKEQFKKKTNFKFRWINNLWSNN